MIVKAECETDESSPPLLLPPHLDVLVAGGLLQLAAVHPVTEGVNYSDLQWAESVTVSRQLGTRSRVR